MSNHSNSKSANAVVVATYSREMDLRLVSGETVRARIKGKKLKPVCGDRVNAMPIENEPQWLYRPANVLSRKQATIERHSHLESREITGR